MWKIKYIFQTVKQTNKQKNQRDGKQGKRDKKTGIAYIKYNPISNYQMEEK